MHLQSSTILLFLLLKTAQEANGSSDCTTTSTSDSSTPSLYHQQCCLNANYGKTLTLNVRNRVKILVCPNAGQPNNALCHHSCSEVLESFPNATSGHYSITHSNGSIISVYCDMVGSNCDGKGGWTRIGYVNMTEPGATCPPGLQIYRFGGRLYCNKAPSGCLSVFFPNIGSNYTEVCGQARAYQFGVTNGIRDQDIDAVYVDGLSVTHGMNPRQHIWTYAAGYTEDNVFACPCNVGNDGKSIPAFVGNDSYCESGAINPFFNFFYAGDALWDGKDCRYLEGPCCTSPNMPWFLKGLAQSTSDDIEMRTCKSQPVTQEAIPFDIVEIYVR